MQPSDEKGDKRRRAHPYFLPLLEMPLMPVPQEKGKGKVIPRKVLWPDKRKGMGDEKVKACETLCES